MGEINLAIHGKNYGIACDDGQEQRVTYLAKYIDTRLREIAAAGAASNESHLLVLTAIVLADEIQELRETMKHMVPANAIPPAPALNPNLSAISREDERQIVAAIEHLALRINSVAQKMQEAA